jgi:hypothetical protein
MNERSASLNEWTANPVLRPWHMAFEGDAFILVRVGSLARTVSVLAVRTVPFTFTCECRYALPASLVRDEAFVVRSPPTSSERHGANVSRKRLPSAVKSSPTVNEGKSVIWTGPLTYRLLVTYSCERSFCSCRAPPTVHGLHEHAVRQRQTGKEGSGYQS